MSWLDKISAAWHHFTDTPASIGATAENANSSFDFNTAFSQDVKNRADYMTNPGQQAQNIGNVFSTMAVPVNTVQRGLSTLGQTIKYGDPFSPQSISDAWENSGEHTTADGKTVEGVSLGQLEFMPKGLTASDADYEARYKYFHENWMGKIASGGVDAAVSLGLDPLIWAGKGIKAAELAGTTVKAKDVSTVVAASAGDIAKEDLGKKTQKAVDSFDSFLKWTDDKSAAEIALHPVMKANAEGGTYAYLMAQANGMTDTAMGTDIKRTLFGAALGDSLSIKALKQDHALLANDLYRLGSTPGYSLSVETFNHADGNLAGLVRANAASVPEVEAQSLAIEREMDRLQRIIDGAATSNVISGTTAQLTKTEWEIAGLRSSTIYSGLGNRAIHIVSGAAQSRLPGHVNLRDPAVGFDQLNATLKRSRFMSGEDRGKLLDSWLKATTDGDRQAVVHQAEAAILKAAGEHWGVAPKDVLTFAALGEKRRNAWVATLKSRLYSAAPDAKYVTVVDPETDSIAAISRPLLR